MAGESTGARQQADKEEDRPQGGPFKAKSCPWGREKAGTGGAHGTRQRWEEDIASLRHREG